MLLRNQLKIFFEQKLAQEYTETKKYKNIVFIGDGHNDFCLGKFLKVDDYLFPRIEFPLHKLINNPDKRSEICCNIFSWRNGLDIINYFKKM